MATKNPRVSVMLKPESDAILTRLSAISKQSKSSIIGEFLEDTCMPMFERMVIVLEAAATATDDAKAAAKQGFEDAEKKLLGVAGLTTDLFDNAASPLLSGNNSVAKPGRGGRRRAADAAGLEPSRPPHVTRGSGTPNPRRKTTNSPLEAGSGEEGQENIPAKASKRPAKAMKPKRGG